MKVDIELKEDVLTLTPDGRLDSASADFFTEAFEENRTEAVTTLVADLEKVDYISSKGLRVLVKARKDMNGSLIIKNANASVLEVLRLSGLSKVFQVE